MSQNSLASILARGVERKSIGSAESGFFSRWNWNRGVSWSGMTVNEQTALNNDTVWACVKLISDTVSTLPLGLYERQRDGTRAPATEHRLYDVLHNEPNSHMSAVTFWQAAVLSMLLWGNAYAEVERIGARIVSLEFLDPARVAVMRGRTGGLEYRYTDYDSTQRTITRDRMFHIPAFTLDGEIGISAIQYGYNSIGSAMATDKAADETFKDATRASGLVTMDAALTPTQREDVRAHVKTVSTNGGVYVLEKGTGFTSLKFSPADAELLASRSFSVETICRWFRVPPVMIGHGDKQSSWPTSTEAQGALFLRYVLRSLISRIEQEIRRSLLTPAERTRYFAEFAIEGLLRGDSAARSAFYSTALQNGWMTRNEVRRLENLPPVEGGDILTVQSNMMPITMIGTAPPQATTVRDALKQWLELDPKEKA
ncbi:phage portal protein [Cupriavidus pauculus]|uniref:phage portal protein n=1 Tax=Cupriavidus pauculus TaxID=82633 RepID=UPI0012FE657A|nr:phage portal protein [Cupriavidus pauculus]